MAKRDRAAYMRAYRARTAEPRIDPAVRIAELEAEVARLKRELAARPSDAWQPTDPAAAQRKHAQSVRDQWLRNMSRGSG